MTTPAPLAAPLLALVSGYLGGSLTSGWDGTLSLKMNLVGKAVDAFKFFPARPPGGLAGVGATTGGVSAASQSLVLTHRANWALAGWVATRNLPAVGRVVTTEVPTRDGDRIRVRIYAPDGAATVPPGRGGRPVLVYLHGGGFCFGGGFDVYEGLCRRLTMGGDMVVVAVEYRLAPEFRFPIPLNDCVDALRWVYSEPAVLSEMGGAPRSRGLALGGDSAGGNLTAATAVLVKSDIPLRLQVLIYPCCSAYSRPASGIIQSHSSLAVHATAYVLPAASLSWLWDMYLANPEKDARDPRASPVMYSPEELTGVAPAVLITASHDVLQDECVAYRDLLRRAGVHVSHTHCTNTFHGFINTDLADGHEQAVKAVLDELKFAFGARSGGRL